MLLLKWSPRHLALTVVPCLIILTLASACDKDRSKVRAGIPAKASPGSFKILMKVSSAGEAAQLEKLNSLSVKISSTIECGKPTVEAMAWAPSALSERLTRRYHVKFAECKLDRTKLETALLAFQDHADIDGVEADAIVQLADESDPLKTQQYHMGRVRRDEACSLVDRAQAKEVIVAVLDTGIDATHPDLSPNLLRDSAGRVIGANFVGKGARGAPDSEWQDATGHGTHVAGLIGAAANNAQGGVGIASCMPIRIMPIRVLDSNGSGSTLEIERGVQWAVANGADILNMSLGSSVYYSVKPDELTHPIYDDAAAQGVIIFAASGNEGSTLGTQERSGYRYEYPSSYDSVISVAATNADNQLAYFSNRGESVDIAVPGDRVLSTLRGGGYGNMSGTSMASPIAAGIYALTLAATRSTNEDRFKASLLEPLLMSSRKALSLSTGDVKSGGILDAKMLLEAMQIKWKKTAAKPISPTYTYRGAPAPVENDPSRSAPPADRAPETGLHFVGLRDGDSVKAATYIGVAGWTTAYTASIQIAWAPEGAFYSRAFTVLTSADLSADGSHVISPNTYQLAGNGVLIATALDIWGRTIETKQISLSGF